MARTHVRGYEIDQLLLPARPAQSASQFSAKGTNTTTKRFATKCSVLPVAGMAGFRGGKLRTYLDATPFAAVSNGIVAEFMGALAGFFRTLTEIPQGAQKTVSVRKRLCNIVRDTPSTCSATPGSSVLPNFEVRVKLSRIVCADSRRRLQGLIL